MTRHLLDEVLDAKQQPPRLAEAVRSIRSIPRWCSCTWTPRFSTVPATWTLTGTDPGCKLHGSSSDEKSGAGA